MTPSHSASSLVDVETAAGAALATPKGERADAPAENGKDGAVAEQQQAAAAVVAVSLEKPASPDAQPLAVQQVFSGGEMGKSPSFLALLFLGKLANVVKKKQRYQ
jgi:hypothetical protein